MQYQTTTLPPRLRAPLLTLAAALAIGACAEGGDDGISVDATGTVAGLVWIDRNGNGILDTSDGPVRDVRVELVPASAGQAAASAYATTATPSGSFLIDDVLVGDYIARVDTATVGDTLRVLRVDSAEVTVEAEDTTTVLVGLTYPSVTTDSARTIQPETRVFVQGLVLTRWGAYGESSLFVRDSTGAIQVVRVAPTGVVPGDSVRVLGTVSIQTGQPVLRDGVVYLLRTGVESPPPDTVTTAQAASALGGELDADLVYVDSAVVQDTSRNAAGDLVIRTNDGTGPVDVILDRDIPFFLSFPDGMIGTILRVTGVLVPASPTGPWVVKPRNNQDVVVGPLSHPAMSTAEARAEPAGTRLILEGRALHAWTTFGDSTLSLRDAAGALRSVRVPPLALAAGDSVRLVGTTGSAGGQTVLVEVRPRRMSTPGPAPTPRSGATARAAAGGVGVAVGGAPASTPIWDAELVRVDDATIQDTLRNAQGEPVLRVNDGSGALDVHLDQNISFQLNFPGSVIGSVIDAAGILVPSGAAWIMKPRGSGDLTVN